MMITLSKLHIWKQVFFPALHSAGDTAVHLCLLSFSSFHFRPGMDGTRSGFGSVGGFGEDQSGVYSPPTMMARRANSRGGSSSGGGRPSIVIRARKGVHHPEAKHTRSVNSPPPSLSSLFLFLSFSHARAHLPPAQSLATWHGDVRASCRSRALMRGGGRKRKKPSVEEPGDADAAARWWCRSAMRRDAPGTHRKGRRDAERGAERLGGAGMWGGGVGSVLLSLSLRDFTAASSLPRSNSLITM